MLVFSTGEIDGVGLKVDDCAPNFEGCKRHQGFPLVLTIIVMQSKKMQDHPTEKLSHQTNTERIRDHGDDGELSHQSVPVSDGSSQEDDEILLQEDHSHKGKLWLGFDQAAIKNALLSLQYIVLYFIGSISLTLFIKYTVSYSKMRFPLMMLGLQMSVNTIICGIISFFIIRSRLNKSRQESGMNNRANWREVMGHLFNWSTFKTLTAFGTLTGLDYGCSSLSLSYLSVSLYTMLKSSVPVFVMLISFILKLEQVRLALIVSIVLISIGVAMTSKGNVHFNIVGVLLVFVAVFFAAIRLVYAQYVLQHNSHQVVYTSLKTEDEEEELESNVEPQEQQNPSQLYTVGDKSSLEYFYARDRGEELRASKITISSFQIFFYSAPVIACTVLPFGLMLEGWRIVSEFMNLSSLEDDSNLVNQATTIHNLRLVFIIKFLSIIVLGSGFGLLLNVSEFLLIKQTSSLTLTVVSIFKELLLILVAVVIFDDQLGVMGTIGYGITVIGLVVYKIQRLRDLKSEDTPHR